MTVLALEHLYSVVTARFAAEGIQAANLFGRRQVAQHFAGARIVWVPGDPGDSVGAMVGARAPGSYPRPLGMLLELFTVYISASDLSDSHDELKQYHITRMLRDAWFRAAYFAAHGTFVIRSETWMTGQTELAHGATIRLVCELQAPVVDALPDAPLVGSGIDQTNTVDARAVALSEDTTLGATVATQLDESEDADINLPPGSIPDEP